jgi:hypothetical protein
VLRITVHNAIHQTIVGGTQVFLISRVLNGLTCWKITVDKYRQEFLLVYTKSFWVKYWSMYAMKAVYKLPKLYTHRHVMLGRMSEVVHPDLLLNRWENWGPERCELGTRGWHHNGNYSYLNTQRGDYGVKETFLKGWSHYPPSVRCRHTLFIE